MIYGVDNCYNCVGYLSRISIDNVYVVEKTIIRMWANNRVIFKQFEIIQVPSWYTTLYFLRGKHYWCLKNLNVYLTTTK